jgi:hypothetical protein
MYKFQSLGQRGALKMAARPRLGGGGESFALTSGAHPLWVIIVHLHIIVCYSTRILEGRRRQGC